ncbi:MAG: hypothetical protein AAGI25_16900 [Bacteroidota bacterium]
MTIESGQIETKESYDHIIAGLKQQIQENPGCKHRTILKAIKTADSIGLRAALRNFCRKTFKEL